MNPWPGTMEQCTHCAKHTERLNDSQGWGWFYCDSIWEVIHFPRPHLLDIPGVCPWFSPGQETHRTPLKGIRQALWLGWIPGPVDSPHSKIDPDYVEKKRLAREILKELGVSDSVL
jgi:hypothetical protein